LAAILALFSGCSREDKPPAEIAEPESSGLEEEFLQHAQALEDSKNRYFGRQQITALQLTLREADLPREERSRSLAQLAFHHLRLGENPAARRAIDTAFQHEEALSPQAKIQLRKARAMIALREAEIENCVQRHNAQCCIFPLAGGGLHEVAAPARAATADLLEILKSAPGDEMVQWLLNLATMATGDYPDAVPEAFRIPPVHFESGQEGKGMAPFLDVAPRLGIDTFDLCGGVVVEDFNKDGWFDILTSTSDPRGSLRLYLSEEAMRFRDATDESGVWQQLGGFNCVAADYDNDGDADVLVLRGAWLGTQGAIRNSLLRNDTSPGGGKVQFTDVTAATGLADPAYPTQTAAWGDLDNDGDLDLFVGNESAKELRLKDSAGDFPSQLFQNNGDGTFTDIAATAGVQNDRFCKGVTMGDYDNDKDLDIFVSNVGKNRLYRNNADGSFTDVAPDLGIAGSGGFDFAPWFFDFNNDGWLDLFVGAYEAQLKHFMRDARGESHGARIPNLYRNNGDGTFTDIAREAGLDHPYLPMGANFGDFDNDGWLDIYLATGDSNFETLTPNVLLKNLAGQRFENVTYAARLGHLQKGHGIAFADFDHDGDLDLYHQLGGFFPGDKFHNALFLNPGNENGFLDVRCRGTKSNRSGFGVRAALTIEFPDGQRQTLHRAAGSLSSFGGSPHDSLHFGIPTSAKPVELRVHWPCSDAEQAFSGLQVSTIIEVVEGKSDDVSVTVP
ncbi:MAG: CRTAC1 family protein, partial [Roseibacillus sp.]